MAARYGLVPIFVASRSRGEVKHNEDFFEHQLGSEANKDVAPTRQRTSCLLRAFCRAPSGRRGRWTEASTERYRRRCRWPTARKGTTRAGGLVVVRRQEALGGRACRPGGGARVEGGGARRRSCSGATERGSCRRCGGARLLSALRRRGAWRRGAEEGRAAGGAMAGLLVVRAEREAADQG